MSRSNSRIYLTRVMHQRNFPVDYRFSYPMFSLLLDLDQLELGDLSTASLCARVRIGYGQCWCVADDLTFVGPLFQSPGWILRRPVEDTSS
jgi:hypothetical protein